MASASTSLSKVDLPESGTASTLAVGRACAVVGTAGQVLAIVAAIPPSVFEVGSSWAVAVLSARSGDAGGATAASLVAVVANVAVRAGDALAALVLSGAFVAVAVSCSAASVVAAAVSTAFVSSASVVGGASTSSCSAVASSAMDVGEPARAAASSTAVASASRFAPVFSRVSVTPVTSTAVVVEAEANPVTLVLEVARGRVVAGAPAMARSSYVSQIGAAVLRACAINVRWRGGVGGAASNN